MTRIHWTTASQQNITATIDGGCAAIPTSNGVYYAPVSIKVTGRTMTKTCAGNYGTKAAITFEDATVSGWVS